MMRVTGDGKERDYHGDTEDTEKETIYMSFPIPPVCSFAYRSVFSVSQW
jgi:hypothetical protein